MARAVKPRRSYDSSRRRAQAAATRREILEAAGRLFDREGFARATISAVAREAGVAPRTVYLAFDSKAGLLRAVWNLRLRGDEGDAPIAERDWYQAVLDESDPKRKVRLVARQSREVKSRIGPLFSVIRGGAAHDPEVAALWSRIEREFYDNQRAIVETLAASGGLRRGLDAARAADLLWTLNHPDVWRALVDVRGWTPDQWEEWFAESACAQIVAPRRR